MPLKLYYLFYYHEGQILVVFILVVDNKNVITTSITTNPHQQWIDISDKRLILSLWS